MRSDAHVPEPGVHLDLGDVQRARRAAAGLMPPKRRQHPVQDRAPEAERGKGRTHAGRGARAVLGTAGLDGDVGARRQNVAPGRVVADAAARLAPRSPDCRRSAAASATGTMVGVVRLPPEMGPRGRLESPILTSISSGSRPKDLAMVAASTPRLPVPMSCTAMLATRPAAANGKLDLGLRLPEIEPVGRGDADAPPEAALLACPSAAGRARSAGRPPRHRGAGGWRRRPSAGAARWDRPSGARPPRRSPAPARSTAPGRPDRGTGRRAAGCSPRRSPRAPWPRRSR